MKNISNIWSYECAKGKSFKSQNIITFSREITVKERKIFTKMKGGI